MFFSDDPAMDEMRYTASRERNRPICDYCGDTITQDKVLVLHGDYICDRCARRNTVTLTEDDYD